MKKLINFNAPKDFIQSAIIATLASTAGYLIGPIEVKYIQTLTDSGFLIGLSYAVGTVVFCSALGLAWAPLRSWGGTGII